MAPIDPIYNGEGGASVRAKLNQLIDTVNSGSQTINVGDAPIFDPNKAGGYEAGSIISYKNESSPDPEFHEFAIYLALYDIPQGVSPEDSPNWKNEGATVEVAGGNTANGVVQSIDRLRELTGMRTGHSVTVEEGGHVYVFNEGSEAGVKPFAPGIGSWELKYTKSVVEWQPGTYRSNPTLVLRNNAIYRLTRPVPFESTDFEAEASDPIPVWTKVSGGGGHTFEDQSGTVLPTRSVAKAGAGIEFEDDAVNEMTVVRVDESLTDHVDGADEVKHTANQIYGGATDDNKIYYVDPTTKKLTPSSFTVDQILQLSSIDVTAPDWQVGEQRLVTVEKTIDEEPSLKGATQLVDLVLPPATVTALEDATGWVGETRTLTGANFFGEIGRIGQRGTGPDGTIYVCIAAVAGTQGQTNGSATFKRNRSVDALDPENNTNDNNIANLLDPTRVGGNADENWDVVNNVLIINTLVCRVGTWFTSGTGYFFMCYDRVGTNFYWRRIGQPQAIQRPINAANYPTLTSNLLAHDFTTGAYQNQSGDETNYQDQTFYDAATRRLFWQVKTGIWEEINIIK